MKKLLRFLPLFFAIAVTAQQQTATFTITPALFDENEQITITVSGVDPTIWNAGQSGNIYLWAWSYDLNDMNSMDSPTNGSWTNSNAVQQLTNNGDGTYSITLTPDAFFQRTGIGRIGMLVKAGDGTGDKKSQDYLVEVGFDLTLTAPAQSITLLDMAGENLAITATASHAADFVLRANGMEIDNVLGVTEYSYNYVVNENTTFELEATYDGETLIQTFQAVITPTVTDEPVPPGMLDGINPDPADDTRATLVLYAPGKEFVHVIGDFNNWQIDDTYLMRRDPATERFWIELTGLTPQYNHMYQYLVEFTINVADPYSTTVLDEFNDPYIDAVTYPGLPAYPSGLTTQAVTLLRLGDPEYNWTVAGFQPPDRTDLVIYEVLLRDFDALHSFDALRNRLDYLQDLGINAIELMPVSEFDGNESWGYNPSFHMALDKYYGTRDTFKQLIDECHSRGMAVILDVVYNHASGQNPYFRMWNDSNGGLGGQATAENPFFNLQATHSYSVFNDFNHQSQAVRDYVNRTVTYWIEEFHIDGFRWDLTKGFTQNCTGSESCTNNYQQDRVDVLEEYADTQWAADPDFYVIFEHLGVGSSANEETEWANYRLDEGKGIMLWNNHNHTYGEATMGYHNNGGSNFSGISYLNKGWTSPSNVSYMESHDEERLMYRNLEYGNSAGNYDVTDLSTALDRIELAGAFFFTVPGPKMIWQFGELGYDYSINDCGNGTIDPGCRVSNKPIRWDYFDDPERKDIYDLWSILINLKLNEPIFRTANFTINAGNPNGLKSIHLTLEGAAANEVGYITIIGNFGVTPQNISPAFQETGVWYNFLNGNLKHIVLDPSENITLQPGEFRIYGNNPTGLLPDLNPPDEDSDGVLDVNDDCAGTPLGATVNVNGCTIFTLPVNNFTVRTLDETCMSSNNGGIEITAQQALNYTATLSGNGINQAQNFTAAATLSNLPAGNYTLCITVTGEPDYEQCFELTINQPEPLSVLAKVNEALKQVTLSLAGGETYYIEVNGLLHVTSESEITLDLLSSYNHLKVTTDKECQGEYKETLLLSDESLVYPNPYTSGNLTVYTVERESAEVEIALYTSTGQQLHSGSYVTQNGSVAISLDDIPKGTYILTVTTKTSLHTHKIIKR